MKWHKADELSEIFFFCLFPKDDILYVSRIRLLEKEMETLLFSCAFPEVPLFLAFRVILFVKEEARWQKALMRLPQRKLTQ